MTPPNLPPELLERLRQIKGKRSRVVVEHILEKGFVTTEELETLYGYKHPPRAVRDVREQGIPIETFQVKDSQGRVIAAYRFATNVVQSVEEQPGKRAGRKPISKTLRKQLILQSAFTCAICSGQFDEHYLQIDHRVPYEVAGEPEGGAAQGSYMVVCASCNRAKSWSCQHCKNAIEIKNPDLCKICYWASPEFYEPIALHPLRRAAVVWLEDEIEIYEQLKTLSLQENQSLPGYIKTVLQWYLNKLE